MNSSPLRSQKLLKNVKARVVVAKKLDHVLDCYYDTCRLLIVFSGTHTDNNGQHIQITTSGLSCFNRCTRSSITTAVLTSQLD